MTVRRELIVYATPGGDLAVDCDRYFAAVEELGSTTAQLYPPHCTLTGFFSRTAERVPEIAREVEALVAASGGLPDDAVTVTGLRVEAEWVGLEISSPWLIEVTEKFVAAHRLDDGDDALRPKDWLHLSLAYGIDDLAEHAALARRMVDPRSQAEWAVGLWERRSDGSWTQL